MNVVSMFSDVWRLLHMFNQMFGRIGAEDFLCLFGIILSWKNVFHNITNDMTWLNTPWWLDWNIREEESYFPSHGPVQMEVKVPVYVCEPKTETVCVCALVCVGVGCLVVIHKGGFVIYLWRLLLCFTVVSVEPQPPFDIGLLLVEMWERCDCCAHAQAQLWNT